MSTHNICFFREIRKKYQYLLVEKKQWSCAVSVDSKCRDEPVQIYWTFLMCPFHIYSGVLKDAFLLGAAYVIIYHFADHSLFLLDHICSVFMVTII